MGNKQFTKEEAIALYKSGWWKGKTSREICALQLYQDKLCMPFSEFHKAITEALGRSVWTHEFAGEAGQARLQAEFEGKGNPFTNPFESIKQVLYECGRDDMPIIAVVANEEASKNERD